MSGFNDRLAGLSPEKRALLMQQLAKQQPVTASNAIGRRQRPERIPLSFAQQRLWILDQLDPGTSTYNVPSGVWLRGKLEFNVLQDALSEIVRRHEILRTVIASDAQGPHQGVLPAAGLVITQHHLDGIPDVQRRAAAMTLSLEEAISPFDLATGPLLRAMLVRVSDDEHLFVLNAHHIAVDGWSYSIIYNELVALYSGGVSGQPATLPELSVQYVDYTLWQRELLADDSPTLRKQLDYWETHLAAPLPVLELPGDRPRPPVQSHRGATVRMVVPAPLYGRLKQLSRSQGSTTFMAVLAVFQTLLLRYSGQSDVVVGVGVANRRRQELEAMVGFFVNTLAVRADLSGDPSFDELLARTKESLLAAYSHQDLPIERLLEALKLDRALSHSPLFQVMFFFQNFPSEEIELPGLTLTLAEAEAVASCSARADLTVFASEQDDELVLYLEYATDLFDAETVVALGGHFVNLVQSIVDDSTRVIGHLPLLSSQESRQIDDWNATARPLPEVTTVHGLIEAQVARSPDAIAIEHNGQSLSYRDLDAQAEALATQLIANGTRRGDLVGLFVERSPRMLVGMLGALKAGAAYVPIDPGYPADRVGFMLDDAAIQVLITEGALLQQLPTNRCTTVMLDDIVVDASAPRVHVGASADDLAYVIFTSGSTGRPKGVQLPHGAAVNFITSVAHQPGMTAADRICAVTTLSFDIAVLELLLPLTVGACIVLADRSTAADGVALARLLESSAATVMQATPATWRLLLDTQWHGQKGLRMFCGGEALTRELADRLLDCGDQLWNLYGPTETTVWSTLEQVQAGDQSISIGKPLDNTQIHIVDRNLQQVPAGVPGELLIGGLGIARGYLDRPALTAEKFIPDPFSDRPGARLYRTGDLARWQRDGRLQVLGRIDHQIKLRGYRIELGEIEGVIAEHPAVREVVVICREDRPGDQRLVAYVVAEPDQQPANAELRAFAKQRLPDYMIPSACVLLEQLPLTPNGKLDRRALPVPEASASESGPKSAPRNPEEEQLVALWAEVLGVEQVGIHDDFFDLGGHSLLATQLISRIQQLFGGDIGLRLIFEAPTVAGFAELLMQQRINSVDSDALANLLDNIEGLSDDEIQRLLSGEDAG